MIKGGDGLLIGFTTLCTLLTYVSTANYAQYTSAKQEIMREVQYRFHVRRDSTHGATKSAPPEVTLTSLPQ